MTLSTSSANPPTKTLSHRDRLRSGLEGKLVLSDDPRWDETRRAWQLQVDQRPVAVVSPESAEDIMAAVSLAREQGLRVAAQGTGHNAAPLGALDDTILLKTERMRGITIDPQRRIARIEAGVRSRRLADAADRYGLAVLHGTSPDVGMAGYTLGGGLGVLGRGFGLACNHVRAVELVTADGRILRADHDNEPDLFWALRGGGGSFGIVTALEFDLLPLDTAYAGTLWYPIDRAAAVLQAWQELTQNSPPDDLTTMGRLLRFPPIPQVPEPLRGHAFAAVHVYHTGDRAEAEHLLAPLRALGPVTNTVRMVQMPALTEVHLDPDQPTSGLGTDLLLADFPADALAALLEVAGPDSAFQVLSVEVRHLGGEFARGQPDNGALASIPAPYILFIAGPVPPPELVAEVQAQEAALYRALTPWASSYRYLNFAETAADPASFWPEETYYRLRSIKAMVDPEDLIRGNHPIPPAAPHQKNG